MSSLITSIDGEDFYREIFSYSNKMIRKKYNNCNFLRADFISAKIEDCEFVNCVLSSLDAANATFINCRFIDCDFKFSNFAKTRFIKCEFIENSDHSHISQDNHKKFESNFDKASFTQAQFLNHCVFSGLYISSTGFKHGIIDGVTVKNCCIHGTSFENCIIKNSNFDILDLRRCACGFLIVKDTIIKKFYISASKAFEIIGLPIILEDCCFEIVFGHDQSIIYNKIDGDLLSLFQNSGKAFAENGQFAQALNCLVTLTHLRRDYSSTPNDDATAGIVEFGKAPLMPGKFSAYESLISNMAEHLNRGNIDIRIDSVVNLIETLSHYGIYSIRIAHIVDAMSFNAFSSDENADEITKGKFILSYNRYTKEVNTGLFEVIFRNDNISIEKIEESILFGKFISNIIFLCGAKEENLYAIERGSVIRKAKNLSWSQVLKVSFIFIILNSEVSIQDGKISYSFNDQAGPIERVIKYTVEHVAPTVNPDITNQERKAISEELRMVSRDVQIKDKILKSYMDKHRVSAKLIPQMYRGDLIQAKIERL